MVWHWFDITTSTLPLTCPLSQDVPRCLKIPALSFAFPTSLATSFGMIASWRCPRLVTYNAQCGIVCKCLKPADMISDQCWSSFWSSFSHNTWGEPHRIDHWYTGIPHFQTEPVAESTAPQDPKLMMLPGGPPMNYSSYISTYLENLPGIYISKANLGINLGMGCIFCFETSNRCFWWFLKPWLWSQHISAVEPIAFAIENGHL